MAYKKNEIALVIKSLQFVRILDYDKHNQRYKVRYFKKRINEVVRFIDNEKQETDWFNSHKSNEVWLHFNELHKINMNYDYWLMYACRYWLRKFFTRKPLPYFDTFILLQYKQSIIAQRIRLKKRKIKIEIKKNFQLYKLIGEWRLRYKNKIGLVSFIHEVMDVETYSKNEIELFYKKILWNERN